MNQNPFSFQIVNKDIPVLKFFDQYFQKETKSNLLRKMAKIPSLLFICKEPILRGDVTTDWEQPEFL
jgi:hypothetical protein